MNKSISGGFSFLFLSEIEDYDEYSVSIFAQNFITKSPREKKKKERITTATFPVDWPMKATGTSR